MIIITKFSECLEFVLGLACLFIYLFLDWKQEIFINVMIYKMIEIRSSGLQKTLPIDQKIGKTRITKRGTNLHQLSAKY